MLTDPKLRSQVDALWDKLWAGGLSNTMDARKKSLQRQSYLLFAGHTFGLPKNRCLELADLYDPPLDSFGQDVVEQWFSEYRLKTFLPLWTRLPSTENLEIENNGCAA